MLAARGKQQGAAKCFGVEEVVASRQPNYFVGAIGFNCAVAEALPEATRHHGAMLKQGSCMSDAMFVSADDACSVFCVCLGIVSILDPGLVP